MWAAEKSSLLAVMVQCRNELLSVHFPNQVWHIVPTLVLLCNPAMDRKPLQADLIVPVENWAAALFFMN